MKRSKSIILKLGGAAVVLIVWTVVFYPPVFEKLNKPDEIYEQVLTKGRFIHPKPCIEDR